MPNSIDFCKTIFLHVIPVRKHQLSCIEVSKKNSRKARLQARNQDFFRAGEFFKELRHCDKHSPTTRERNALLGKNLGIFHHEILKI